MRIKNFIIFIKLIFKSLLRATTTPISTLPTTQETPSSQIVDKTFDTTWAIDLVNEFSYTPSPVYSSSFGERHYNDSDRVGGQAVVIGWLRADGSTISSTEIISIPIYKPQKDVWLEETPDTPLSTDNEELKREAINTLTLITPTPPTPTYSSFFEDKNNDSDVH